MKLHALKKAIQVSLLSICLPWSLYGLAADTVPDTPSSASTVPADSTDANAAPSTDAAVTPSTDAPSTDAATTANLEVLDARPNQLHGTPGLHSGRVPLGTISPNTLKTFVQAVDLMRREYVDVVDDETLFYHAINGMLSHIDRNAEFLDAKAFSDIQSFTEGQVASVGVTAAWQARENHWVVTEVAADSPAKLAGIEPGDYLHQIGEVKLNTNQTDNDIAQLLSGISGTNVEVTFSKAGRSKKSVNLTRNQAKQSQIEMIVQNGIVIIKLPVFQNNTRQEILNQVAHAGIPIQGMIIDLRNNPGGVLEAAVDVASLFMRKQVVTQVQNRQGIERVMETQGSPLFESLPLIILQNRYSASASEVLASSLQTQNRALVVGETSYGKGSVQSVIPLDHNQGIKLTTAHYLTAKGVKIDGVGVIADVSFEENPTNEDWLQLAINLMERAKLPATEGVKYSPVGGF